MALLYSSGTRFLLIHQSVGKTLVSVMDEMADRSG